MMQNQSDSQKLTQTQQQMDAQTQGSTGGEKVFANQQTQFSFDMKVNTKADDFMRKPRSQAYMDIIASIDLLSANDEEIIERLKEVVDEDTLEEFADMTVEELMEELRLTFEEEMAQKLEALEQDKAKDAEPIKLLAVISKCYISGCDIHAIDRKGNIIEHYNKSKTLPKEWEYGRRMYHKAGGSCSCVEIYSNCCRMIQNDGSVETEYYE